MDAGLAPVPRERWLRGEEIKLNELPIEEVGKGVRIVITEATYYMANCRMAGVVQGLTIEDGAVHLQVEATGTTSEALLKFHSGQPSVLIRCHRCPEECSGERVADELVHARKGRLMKGPSDEEAWVRNLLNAEPGGEDELRDLRARDDHRLSGGGEAGRVEKAPVTEKDDKVKKKSKKKDAKKKKQKKKKASSSASVAKKEKKAKKEAGRRREISVSSSESSIGEDGKRPRTAAQKSLRALFRGTGLDPRERVRKRVTRRAKRAAKRSKSDRSSGSSRTSTETGASEAEDSGEVDLFEADSKLKRMADAFPGALSSSSLSMMRQNLLQSIGEQVRPSGVQPVCMTYYRQQLHRRATPPVQRELVTLSAALDWLLRGYPARTADVLSQRLKSIETVLGGTHWSVAQRMELAPQKGLYIAAPQEVSAAQKDYAESKVRSLAAMPDGRKGKGKSTEKGKDFDSRRDKGKGKNSNKGDKQKAKDDNAK